MTHTLSNYRLITIAVLTAFFLLGAVHAANPVPELTDPVVDLANILQPAQRTELSAWLRALSEQTGVQIAVLTITSLAGENLEGYSMRVAEQWKLGQAGKDNGALLLISLEDRQVRIEVGYGLEGKLTDMKSGLIIRNIIIPHFRTGDFPAGINDGIKAMAGIATDNAEIVPPSLEKTATTDAGGAGFGIVFFIIFLMILSKATGRRGFNLFSMLFFAGLTSQVGRHSGGRYKSGGSGFGGGGFGGGSSFGGGGGGFGGGGASCRW